MRQEKRFAPPGRALPFSVAVGANFIDSNYQLKTVDPAL